MSIMYFLHSTMRMKMNKKKAPAHDNKNERQPTGGTVVFRDRFRKECQATAYTRPLVFSCIGHNGVIRYQDLLDTV